MLELKFKLDSKAPRFYRSNEFATNGHWLISIKYLERLSQMRGLKAPWINQLLAMQVGTYHDGKMHDVVTRDLSQVIPKVSPKWKEVNLLACKRMVFIDELLRLVSVGFDTPIGNYWLDPAYAPLLKLPLIEKTWILEPTAPLYATWENGVAFVVMPMRGEKKTNEQRALDALDLLLLNADEDLAEGLSEVDDRLKRITDARKLLAEIRG